MNYNLLPWREAVAEKRRLYRQCFAWLTIFILLFSVSMISRVLYEKVQTLRSEAQNLEKELDKTRQQVMMQGSSIAPASVHKPAGLYALLRSMFAAMNDGVCFTSLHVMHSNVAFHGQVNNDIALSHFLMTWPISNEFSSLKLQSLNDAPEWNGQVFEIAAALNVSQSRLSDDQN